MLDRVFLLALLCVCGTMTLWLCREIMLGLASRRWPVASGQVHRSSVIVVRRIGLSACISSVHYSYIVAGADYEGARILFGLDSTDNSSVPYAANHRLDRYAPNAAVKVHYDPKSPSRAVLETGITMSTYVYATGRFAAVCCLIWALFQ